MYCIKFVSRNNLLSPSAMSKVYYSRRSDRNINSFKVGKSNGESFNDTDNMACEVNSNWELLTPRGFRFYLPGSIGPGWTNEHTTYQPTETLTNNSPEKIHTIADVNEGNVIHYINQRKRSNSPKMLLCVAQECPILLRKGIKELFPGCLETFSPDLTIVTMSQKAMYKTKWSKEMETESFAKHFVLAASELCSVLKVIGYWADFINPFSGQPYFGTTKKSTLYETDERFRCLGFKIQNKKNCKIISCDDNVQRFIGSLYTTAPSCTLDLKGHSKNKI